MDWSTYFGAKPPNELKRPVLRGQLETMRQWNPSLSQSSNTTLKELGVKLASAVTVADAAVKAGEKAEQENRDFRAIGERKVLIDALNAVRKSVYGKLSKMPHELPGEHLPAAFAEDFFRHDPRKAAAKPTVEELKEQAASLQEQLTAVNEQLAAAQAEEDAAAQAKKEDEAHAAAIAEAEKEAAAAAAKLAALKAKKK